MHNQDKQNILAFKSDYFLNHSLKHVFWVLKRTNSLSISFGVPTTCFGLEIRKYISIRHYNLDT